MNRSGFSNFVLAGIFLLMAVSGASAEGDVAKGEKNFKRCVACHSLEEGKKKIGPTLFGIIGRTAGTTDGFKYSPDYIEAGKTGLVWNAETIFAYLEDPKTYLAEFLKKDKKSVKSRMTAKFKKEDFRKDVIAYLESLQKTN